MVLLNQTGYVREPLDPPFVVKRQKNLFPNAQILSDTGLSLPSGPNLSKSEIRKISFLVKNYVNKFSDKKTRP